MPRKYIITDIDGVVLDWEEGFSVWMEHHGHQLVEGYQFKYNIGERYGMTYEAGSKLVKQFNESAAIGFLPPLRDAQYYVKVLHEKHQYKFVALTSLSLDPYAKELRTRNLKKLMGEAFEKIICLDTGADKDEDLEALSKIKKYAGSWWIEDKPDNLLAGSKQGFKGILMEHGHNMHKKVDGYVAKNWEDIYQHVIAEDKGTVKYER
jgi:FMN phosphatase YigB (HAD superfamily)